MAEIPRDHATLDKLLKKQDKNYYTDDLLGRLTLNDKQYAIFEQDFDGTDPGEVVTVDNEDNYVINPIEINEEVVPFVEEPEVVNLNPVSDEVPERAESAEPLPVVDAAVQAETEALAEAEATTADEVNEVEEEVLEEGSDEA